MGNFCAAYVLRLILFHRLGDLRFDHHGRINWGDLLTAYNGTSTGYDSIGNMGNNRGWTYTWTHGRELATMSDGNITWTNTYNADGIRTKRTNGSTTYQYVYNGSSLSQMTVGGNTLNFAYDASGSPMAVVYNGAVYYYITNLQGDVVAILDSAKNAVVEYTYDAWGRILTTSGSMATTLGVHNPLRYRGYVYDSEVGLYYLQSRYYDPQLGRFINADVLAATGQGPVGNNMFTYCLNNPVNRTDSGGNLGVMFWSFVGVVAISAGANAISTAISGGSLEECLLAGLAGGAGAAAGFAVAWATGFSPQGNILGRATATVVSDLGTAWLINGELTAADYVQAGIDGTMDVCFSTVGYYYTTSIENEIVQNCANAGLDGLTDVAETKLFYTTSGSTIMNTNYSGFLPNSAKTSGGTYQNVAYMY